jgi:hypothetical protein
MKEVGRGYKKSKINIIKLGKRNGINKLPKEDTGSLSHLSFL